jgi:hypothetical protein
MIGLGATCCSLYVAEFRRAVLIALHSQVAGLYRAVQSNENPKNMPEEMKNFRGMVKIISRNTSGVSVVYYTKE